VRLLKLTIQNFMSIRYAEVNLANQGLVLLQGVNQDSPAFDSNGAGKSSIFEALTYVLFEKTIRGLAGKVKTWCCILIWKAMMEKSTGLHGIESL